MSAIAIDHGNPATPARRDFKAEFDAIDARIMASLWAADKARTRRRYAISQTVWEQFGHDLALAQQDHADAWGARHDLAEAWKQDFAGRYPAILANADTTRLPA